MYCGKCGAEIQEGVKFCANCGAQCNVSDVEHKKTNHDKKGKLKKKIGIVLLVVLILLFVAGGFFLRSTEKHSETSKNDTEQTVDDETSKPEKLEKEETLICPQFIGQTVDSISNNEDYQDSFQIDIVWEYNDDYDYGHVYAQSVTESTAISEGSTITLYVSKGADEGYLEVAKQYATAIFMYDYGTVKKCLPYNPDSVVAYTHNPEGWIQWETSFPDMSTCYRIETSVKNSLEMNEDEILQAISVIDGLWSHYGVVFEGNSCIDFDKITKGYQVTVSIIPFEIEENERYTSADVTYIVVKYDGEWKVISDFIFEQQRQDEAGRW